MKGFRKIAVLFVTSKQFMRESSISKLAHSAFTKTYTFEAVKEEIKKIDIIKEGIQKIFDKF